MVVATVPIHQIDPPLSKLFKDVDLLRVDDIVHYAGDHWRHSSPSIYVRSLLPRLAKGRSTRVSVFGDLLLVRNAARNSYPSVLKADGHDWPFRVRDVLRAEDRQGGKKGYL